MKKKLFTVLFVVLTIFFTSCSFPTYTVNEYSISNLQETINQNDSRNATIYLIRHGKTILNNNGRAQGWADAPLIPSAEEEIKQVGRKLAGIAFVAAYSSDSGRAIQTARLIMAENKTDAKKLPLIEKKGIREVYFGSYEGEKMDVLWKMTAKHFGFKSKEEYFTTGGNRYEQLVNYLSEIDKQGKAENFQELKKRSFREMKEIAEKVYQNGGGDVLVVSHGITINAILSEIDSGKVSQEIIKNGSVVKLSFDGRNWTVTKMALLNDIVDGLVGSIYLPRSGSLTCVKKGSLQVKSPH